MATRLGQLHPMPESLPQASTSEAGVKRKLNWKKGPPSCGECVRLKLKCTRSWPCSNCVRRGCSQLCPTGELKPRESLALQKQVKRLLAENQRLRAELPGTPVSPDNTPLSGVQTDLQSAHGYIPENDTSPHRVLSQTSRPAPNITAPPQVSFESEVLSVVRAENHLNATGGLGSGVMETSQEQGRFNGRGAGALYFCEEEEEELEGETGPNLFVKEQELVFPFMSSNPHLLGNLHTNLPNKDEAYRLVRAYYNKVEWMYCPSDRQAIQAALETMYSAPSFYVGVHRVSPHRLATVLMAFALAEIFTRGSFSTAACYFSSASSLLTMPKLHFMVQHSLAAVECLHMMVTFLFSTGQPGSAKAAWPLLGMCIRVGCALGLHRDASSWGVMGQEKTQRERLWWECLTYDMLQSLNFGRPYSVPMHLSDCTPPMYTIPSSIGQIPSLSSTDLDFHSLKYQLTMLFSKVADILAAPQLPSYDVVLQVDGELRAVEAGSPPWLRWREQFDDDIVEESRERQLPQQHQAALLIHKALLALHRPWFSKAMQEGTEPLLGPFAPSFTACISSARRHTQLMSSILRQMPEAAYAWWFFLFHTYTAAVIQALVLLRTPGCMMANDVRVDFALSFQTVSNMAPASRLARRALPMLSKLRQRLNHDISGQPDAPLSLDMPFTNGCSASEPVSNNEQIHFDFPEWEGQVQDSQFDITSRDPASILLASGLPPVLTDQMEWASLDPLFQTLLYWNGNDVLGASEPNGAEPH